ncbi:MAG: hypothetical protein M1833_003405 [Piccolia ochrophora]|nr:MAG: hypothetical protein M1833_003405 [Piccolia ochrophora]
MFCAFLWPQLAVLALAIASNCSAEPETYRHGRDFVPYATLRVTVKNIQQSCFLRQSVVINGTSPGPELRLVEGKTTWIRVYNDMDDRNLTMHWHGLTMDVSPFSDGTPQASQWPIPPHHFFDYEIHPKVGHAGTYFYHSHVGFQSVTAVGPLIVQEGGKAPYEYDEEKYILMTDAFNKTDKQIESGLTATPFVWSGESQDVLVNGQGRMLSANCSSSLATIDVKPDRTYRLRFINAAALSFFVLAIQEHKGFQIIEADAQYTKRYKTDFLQMGSGERYSVILKTKGADEVKRDRKKGITNYFIQIETRDRPTLTRSYAILRYIIPRDSTPLPLNPAPPATPPFPVPATVKGFLDYDLRPQRDNDFPTAAQVTRRVTIKVQQLLDGTIIWVQNGIPWYEYTTPTPFLVSLYKGDTSALPDYDRALANNGIDPKTRAFPARIGEVLEIVFQNSGSKAASPGAVDVHPFHAHGAHFYNIGSGPGTYDPAANEKALKGKQPVKRDSTMLFRYENKTEPGGDAGWRAWRLRATQPGAWMIHCHILQHMIMGMQTIWVFGNQSDILTVPRPMIEGYLDYGGDVMGNSTHAPRGVKYFKD